ncbi:MAG: hypothetical protein Q9208_005360 [Pyrenodesmia sp. 3 TL-2023]
MHLKLYLALSALCILATTQAQEIRVGVAGAIRNATERYNTTNARLSEIRSDCVQDGFIYFANCNNTFAEIATDITRANGQLQTATQLFVPRVNCAYISNEFKTLRDRILLVNAQLRQRACSTEPLTKVAVTSNANAIRTAILDQVDRINTLSRLFAANNACNRPQTASALATFQRYVQAVKNDDVATAESFALVGGLLATVRCVL